MDVIDVGVIDAIITFAASFIFILVKSFLLRKTTDHVPGDATKAAKELVKQTTTVSCVTSASHKRCAYCDTISDHVTGVCDRCGAPL